MPKEKKVVQDIVPTHKRTIRSIPKKTMPVVEEEREEQIPIRRAPASISIPRADTPRMKDPAPSRSALHMRRLPHNRTAPTKKRRFPGILLTFVVIFVSIAVIAVALSLLYSKAAVTITPKTANIQLNGTFTAKKAGDVTAGNGLVYDPLSVTVSQSQIVAAKEGALIQTKAKGTVTLYNAQPTQQKIVAGTRLSNSEGKIYRTTATVVIPAQKTGTPGAVPVSVLADEAGAEYDMTLSDPLDLKVVAYKGTPKYETVYAKVKTALTGGFSGHKTTVAPEVQSAAITSIKEVLNSRLLEEAKTQTSKESILYPNAYTIEYTVLEPVSKGPDTAEVTVKGTLSAATFKKMTLLKSIAAKELDKFPAPTYDITGLDTLQFTVVNAKDFSPRKGSSLIFTLKGAVNLVGTFSESSLKEELKGTYLKDSNSIFANYPSIANAYALITPFWMRSFPNSPEKIIIEVKK